MLTESRTRPPSSAAGTVGRRRSCQRNRHRRRSESRRPGAIRAVSLLEEEMAQHVRILAWLHGIFGGILACLGVALLMIVAGSGAISGDRPAMFVTGTVGTAPMIPFLRLSIPSFTAAW